MPSAGAAWPIEPPKDIVVDLPAGLLGNPGATDRCAFLLFAGTTTTGEPPSCPAESQVGVVTLRENGGMLYPPALGPIAIYNLVPPAGAPARFGFSAFGGAIALMDVRLRSDGDYGISVNTTNIPAAIALAGVTATFWGLPGASAHDDERFCPKVAQPAGALCPSNAPLAPFLRNPTACTPSANTGLETAIHADSWLQPGAFTSTGAPDLSEPSWKSASSLSHAAPGFPYPPEDQGEQVGIDGCSKVHFNPQIEAAPTTDAADSPSGLDFHLRVPQGCWEHPEEICQSDLRDAEVTLPQGMTLNPAAADGLGACTPEQIGLTTPAGSTPIHFDQSPADCPASSRIGEIEIETPLLSRIDSEGKAVRDANGTPLPEPLEGSVYLAKQGDNPFDSLLAMYLVAEGSGVVIKQAGRIEVGPGGRLTTVVEDAPQTPFSDLHLQLFGGPRAALRTPPTCGTFAVTATLNPWSGGAPAEVGSGFEIDRCPNSGFDPRLSAGTENPVAGRTSPFSLRLTRDDGTDEIAGLRMTLPRGLVAYLKGIPYCSDATLDAISRDLGTGAGEIAHPSCPAASLVGHVTAGAGAGPTPFYTTAGRAYWAGPYRGAPVSLAVVFPAVAGPFDLGNVVIRNAFEVDPETAQITAVSDPIPTSLFDVPLDLRDVRVELDRPDYVLNPTSCEEMSFEADIASARGGSAHRSERFQVTGCDRLAFRPRLSLKLTGGIRRSANPGVVAVLRPRPGNANIGRVSVALPHSEFLDQSHIRTICTRVQFAADACPAGSVYGRATATSPILDYPLTGKVYLRSSDNPLPDMVLKLEGPASQPLEIDAVGRIDSIKGGIRTSFDVVPDAPVSKLVLRLPAGKKSLLENSTNICRGTHRATVQMDGQNGKIHDFRPLLKADCGGGAKGAKRRRG